MKNYQIYYHPIKNIWGSIPQDVPLIHKGLMILCAIAALTFILGVSPLGFLTLPLFIYLAIQRLWKRLFLIFLITLAIIVVTLITNFIGEYVSDFFKSHPDAWWNNLFIKIIALLFFLNIYYHLIAPLFMYGVHLLDWDEIIETKQDKLEKKGYMNKGTSTGRSRKEAISKFITDKTPPVEQTN